METCIYCLEEKDSSHFKGVEHVIPQAFGVFGAGTPTLKCVCDKCNGYFGKELDQYLSRETIVGIQRYSKGQLSSEARPQKHLQITLAEGPEIGTFAGMKVALDGTNNRLLPPKAQFQVMNKNTGSWETYFEADIPVLTLPEDIYGKPGSHDEPGTWKARIFTPTKEAAVPFIELLNKHGINYVDGGGHHPPLGDSVDGIVSFPVEVSGEIGPTERRAVAKILLNFLAYYLGKEKAKEPQWNHVRNYIRFANGEIKWRHTKRPFWDGIEHGWRRLPPEGINVRIYNLNDNATGFVQFYSEFGYEMILAEGYELAREQQIAYRFCPGQLPMEGTLGPSVSA